MTIYYINKIMKDLTNTSKPNINNHSYPIDSYIKSKKNQVNPEKVNKEQLEIVDKYDLYTSNTENSVKLGNIEYTKRVVNALKEVIKDNEDLKSRMKDVIHENLELRKEIKENYKAIHELGRFYYYCINNHCKDKDDGEDSEDSENDHVKSNDDKNCDECNDVNRIS